MSESHRLAAVVERLRGMLAANDILAGEDMPLRHFSDRAISAPENAAGCCIVYPRSTEQVSAVLRECHREGIAVVPQGGMTGMSGGAVPLQACIVLATERMALIETVDSRQGQIRLQAGVPLQVAQEAAAQHGFLLPMDIGSRGSCLIGGTAATNAGGMRVIRYGMMRNLVLGIEVVLADGTVLSDMSGLLKNNAGFDLKQLFVGSEGTLGVITRLVVRLFPLPLATATACCALADFDAGVVFLDRARRRLGESLAAFEAMWPDFFALGCTPLGRSPFSSPAGLYILLEAEGADDGIEGRMEELLAEAIADGLVADAVIPQSEAIRRELWSIREPTQAYANHFRPSVGFDVGIQVDRMARFVAECRQDILRLDERLASIFYGHIADNNLHIGVKLQPDGPSKMDVQDVVYNCVRRQGGTISAEHGIGATKRGYLGFTRSPQEIAVMRAIKHMLDPSNIMNPGKVL